MKSSILIMISVLSLAALCDETPDTKAKEAPDSLKKHFPNRTLQGTGPQTRVNVHSSPTGMFNPYASTMGMMSSGFVNPYTMNPAMLGMMGSMGMNPYSMLGMMGGMGMGGMMGGMGMGGMGMGGMGMGGMGMGGMGMGGMGMGGMGMGGMGMGGMGALMGNPVNQLGMYGSNAYNAMSLNGGMGMNPYMTNGMNMMGGMGMMGGMMSGMMGAGSNPYMMGGSSPMLASAGANPSFGVNPNSAGGFIPASSPSMSRKLRTLLPKDDSATKKFQNIVKSLGKIKAE